MDDSVLSELVSRHCGGVAGLAGLFFEAADTERRLPRAFDLRVKACWPETADDAGLAYGYSGAVVNVAPASASAVRNYDWALRLTVRLSVDDRKLVWACAHSAVRRQRGPAWSKIGRMLGVHPETVKRRFERAILELYYGLKKNELGG